MTSILHEKKNIYKLVTCLLAAIILLNPFQSKSQSILSTIAGNGTGSSTGDAGLATAATLNQPAFIVKDAAGNLYIGESNRIRKIDLTTGLISTYLSGLGNIRGLAFYNGDLYFAETSGTNAHTIRKYSGTGSAAIVAGTAGTASTTATAANGDGGLATAATLNTPSGITIDATGNLFIADRTNHKVRMVNLTSGIISTILGDGTAGTGTAVNNGLPGLASSAKINQPTDVKLDASGNLYVSLNVSACVVKVTNPTSASTANATVIAGTYGTGGNSGNGGLATAAKLSSPNGLIFDNYGVLYIIDNGSVNSVKYVLPNGILDLYAGQTGTGAYGGDGGSPTATSATAYFNFNSSCAGVFDAAGNLYLGDRGNNRIRKITPPLVPLPIKLSSFTAQKSNQQVVLNWQTSSEINASHFIVQRSLDGRLFVDISTVPAFGASNDVKNYTSNDAVQGISNKKIYYRLQLVDKNGIYTYSDIRVVDFSNNMIAVSVYPNPLVGNSFILDLGQMPTQIITYTIINAAGRVISTGNTQVAQKLIGLSNMLPGIYYIKLSTDQSIKIIK